MAIRNFIGIETGDLSEFVSSTGTISASQDITPRSGDYCLRVNPTTTAAGNAYCLGIGGTGAAFSTSVATLYASCWFYIATAPGSGDEECFSTITSTPGRKLQFRLTSARKIDAYAADGTTLLASGTTVLALNTWHRVEWKCGIESGAGAGDGVYELYLNGTSEYSGTGVTGTANCAGVRLGKVTNRSSQSVDFYFDDLILDDAGYPSAQLSSTTAQILRMDADGAGAATDWTGTYADVDEIPHDSDTTYIYTSTSGQAETVSLESGPSAGITGTVHAVMGVGIIREEPSVSSAFQLRLRSGTTNTDTTSFNASATYTIQRNLQATDPATSSAWALSALNSVEVGVEANANVEHRCTMLCAMVLFTAGDSGSSVSLAGEIDGIAALAASRANVLMQIVGSANAAAAASAGLNLGLSLSGTEAAASSFSMPSVVLSIRFSGADSAAATLQSALSLVGGTIALAGPVAAVGAVNGTLTVFDPHISLLGPIQAAAQLTAGPLRVLIGLQGSQSAVSAFRAALQSAGASTQVVWSARGENVGWRADGEWYDINPGAWTLSGSDEGEVLN